MARTDTLRNFLSDVAAAIKAKKGDDTAIPAADFDTEIANLPSGSDDETLKSLIDRSITSVTIPTGTTLIGWAAFQSCNNLIHITIPEGVQSLDTNSFYGCKNLESVDFPNTLLKLSNNAFYGCSKISSLIIPSNVNGINYGAFQSCTGLTSVTFKGTPSSINSTVFNSCTNLTTINVPWAEGAVANAPWGATNATINYNYTEESEET